jgi:hypothetical protein
VASAHVPPSIVGVDAQATRLVNRFLAAAMASKSGGGSAWSVFFFGPKKRFLDLGSQRHEHVVGNALSGALGSNVGVER